MSCNRLLLEVGRNRQVLEVVRGRVMVQACEATTRGRAMGSQAADLVSCMVLQLHLARVIAALMVCLTHVVLRGPRPFAQQS